MLQNLKSKMLLALAALLLAGQIGMAQVTSSEYQFSERAVSDLIRGIKSENEGLKKSAIYFAGIYQVNETVDPLIAQLDNEGNAEIRVLIALVLYRIGDIRGIDAVKHLAVNDESDRVKRMSAAILKDFDLANISDKGSLTWMLLNAE